MAETNLCPVCGGRFDGEELSCTCRTQAVFDDEPIDWNSDGWQPGLFGGPEAESVLRQWDLF